MNLSQFTVARVSATFAIWFLVFSLSGITAFEAYGVEGDDAQAATSQNWPMWRFDSHRSANSPNSAPEQLELLWKNSYSERLPVWDDPLNQDLMTFDRVFEPIVLGGRFFVGFNDADKLVALDTSTGEVLWTFFADGPIRLPPVGWEDRIFVCSDDGYLYCLAAETGDVVWSFRGGPNAQKALGNRRLVSAWPARGGPVVWEDTIYFAASIWPFMGTFIYALDAETGRVEWVNDSTGAQYIKQPHSAPSFAGVGPQGALVATEEFLIVPGGRSVPAVFRRSNGEFVHFEINAGGKGTGGSFVAADAVQFYVHTRERGTRAFDIASGVKTAFTPNEPAIAGDLLFAAEIEGGQERIVAYEAGIDEKRKRDVLWSIDVPSMDDLVIAGNHLVAAGQGKITIVERPTDQEGRLIGGKIIDQVGLGEKLSRLIVADHKIFAIADSGTIFAIGSGKISSPSLASGGSQRPSSTQQRSAIDNRLSAQVNGQRASERLVQQLLDRGESEGYAFWFGECSEELLTAWARLSPFVQLIFVDSNADRVDAARRLLDSLGAYGKITIHQSGPADFRPPQYIAHMVFVTQEMARAATDDDWQTIYSTVRPYGGTLLVPGIEDQDALVERLEALQLEKAEVSASATEVVVRRVGALPGAADWTHQHGDIANSVKSNDSRVRLPLGVLWFGGNSNMDVLPRHGHGPPQQIVAGRLIIQGMSSLSARDVYTGRVFWHRDFEDLGTFDVYYDHTYEDAPLNPQYNQVHIPGANARGTNYVVTEDLVYLVVGNQCRILDVETGEDRGEITLPRDEDGDDPEWGFIGIYENVLIGGVGFAKYRERLDLEFEADKLLKGSKAGFGSKSLDRAASRSLIGFDRQNGRPLWKVDATHSFWHNGIVAGGGKIYCLDRNPPSVEQAMKRRGLPHPDSYRILAIDHQTGDALWEVNEHIFGTWLGYSQQHDLLLQAGARASDRLADEVGKGMRVYNAKDGSLRWAQDDLSYNGPCILHNNWIITNTNSYSLSAGAYDIRTGQQRMKKNSITGQMVPWQLTRAYGCNKIIASENLLTFRSGAAGFYDLLTDSGTGNWGGFKSGCTSNLIVANGVMNAPDYTRTCSCAYQNQTSLALVHMPDIDVWTINLAATLIEEGIPIQSLGINFGAPGDRRDSSGVLWVEHPCAAGDSPPIAITFNEGVQFFQHHTTSMLGSELPWVQASGAIGATELRVQMVTQKHEEDKKQSKSKEKSSKPEEDSEVPSEKSIADDKKQVDLPESRYRVELFFGLPEYVLPGEVNQFEVKIAGHSETQLITLENHSNFEASAQEQSSSTVSRFSASAVCTFDSVKVIDELTVLLEPRRGVPVINGLRVTKLD